MSLFRLARPAASFRQPFLYRTFLTTRPCFNEQPTILSTLQPELKSAMRAKDKPRLTVLRALMAEITNASKTPKPVATDAALYSLLSKHIKASQAAVQEFEAAKRQDLVDKEQEQINILEGYLGQIQAVGEEEIRNIVKEAIGSSGQPKVGQVIGKVMSEIKSRPVDSELVKKVVEEVVGQKS